MNSLLIQQKNRGAALLLFILLFLAASTILVFGIGRGVYEDLVRQRTLALSKESFFAAEAAAEDAIYRHRRSMLYGLAEIFTLQGATVQVTKDTVVDHLEFYIVAEKDDMYRKNYVELTLGNGASFAFGLQSDEGGIIMENFSSVTGNVYANGSVVGSGSNLVRGGVVSAGPSGYVEGVHATGSVWSHTIDDSLIDEDAYYDSSITATIVGGTSYPGSPDQPTSTLPIPDTLVAIWESFASENGTTTPGTCPWVITTDTTLGPGVITCDIEIRNSPTITLDGTVWIQGSLAITNTPTIVANPSLGNRSVQIIVDNPTNRATSSKIDLRNSTTFVSGSSNSYVLLLSMNESAESGGSEPAIIIEQSTTGKVLVYAGHGEVQIRNSANMKEVTGYRIRLRNSANVQYETGLASLVFEGSGGGYVLTAWREIE